MRMAVVLCSVFLASAGLSPQTDAKILVEQRFISSALELAEGCYLGELIKRLGIHVSQTKDGNYFLKSALQHPNVGTLTVSFTDCTIAFLDRHEWRWTDSDGQLRRSARYVFDLARWYPSEDKNPLKINMGQSKEGYSQTLPLKVTVSLVISSDDDNERLWELAPNVRISGNGTLSLQSKLYGAREAGQLNELKIVISVYRLEMHQTTPNVSEGSLAPANPANKEAASK